MTTHDNGAYVKSTTTTVGVLRVTSVRSVKVGCAVGKWRWWRGGWGAG